MAGDDDVREGQQALEDVVIDDLVRQIGVEEIAFLFVDVERDPADLALLSPSISALVSISAPRLVLTIIIRGGAVAMAAASIKCRVIGVSGQWSVTISAAASNSAIAR